MTKKTVDREELKELIREVLREEPQLILAAISSFTTDSDVVTTDKNTIPNDEAARIIEQHFKDYDRVFRALA